MPVLEEWIQKPLKLISDLFGHSNKLDVEVIKKVFVEKLTTHDQLKQIPSLNDTPPYYLKPNTLVRFRCIIQDQFDPEYYLGVYESINRSNNSKRLRTGIYRDITDCEQNEEIDLNSPQNITMERQSLYCVPIPGENQWVKNEYARIGCTVERPLTKEIKSHLKRARDNDDMEAEEIDTSDFQCHDHTDSVPGDDNAKRQRSSETDAASSSAGGARRQESFDLNFPLPEEKGCPCLVTVYDNSDSLKLNEAIEFIGILSVDPQLAASTMKAQDSNEADHHIWSDLETPEERLAHCPPPSLVPRLHCIVSRKLDHDNPLLPQSLWQEENKLATQSLLAEVPGIRCELLQILTRLLFGDSLAAEYVLLNLISRVYGRVDVMALGNFPINLTNCQQHTGEPILPFVQQLFELIQNLTTKSHAIPLTVSNLNTQKFIPKKDYTANRLLTGRLQLSEGTHLILDETAMEPGQLDSNGISNLTALGNLIRWQKVDYDFSFHKSEMKADVSVLVLSEARSIFQCECMVPIKRQDSLFPSTQSFLSTMDPGLLSKIRMYLDLVRLMNFVMPDHVQEAAKEDYVRMREANPKDINADVFHLLLATARLVALSYGQSTATVALWNKAKELDAERRQRIKQ